MVEKNKGLGPVKRFGVRYGRTTKFKRAQVEIMQKKPQQCPYCRKYQVKRLSLGVFSCKKCLAKFTGRAYTVAPIVFEESKEEPVNKELVEEESEDENNG